MISCVGRDARLHPAGLSDARNSHSYFVPAHTCCGSCTGPSQVASKSFGKQGGVAVLLQPWIHIQPILHPALRTYEHQEKVWTAGHC